MTAWEGLNPPYATIVADPPWPYRGTGSERLARVPTRVGRVVKDVLPEAHYSTMTLDEIAAMPVHDLIGRNAHAYLWVTCAGLPDGFKVLDAWGFTYKTCVTWKKLGHLGLGAYFRTQTEHVLFGVRGSLPTRATDERNIFEARKRGHSVKPPEFGDLVERSSPGPYVELFARQPRLGWDHWGYGYEQASA